MAFFFYQKSIIDNYNLLSHPRFKYLIIMNPHDSTIYSNRPDCDTCLFFPDLLQMKT